MESNIQVTTDEPLTTDLPPETQEDLMGPVPTGMTDSQERHLLHLKGEFMRKLDAKYRTGAKEHGGDIRDNTIMQLLDEGLAECIDQYVYLSTIKSELERIILDKPSSPTQYACQLIQKIDGTPLGQ